MHRQRQGTLSIPEFDMRHWGPPSRAYNPQVFSQEEVVSLGSWRRGSAVGPGVTDTTTITPLTPPGLDLCPNPPGDPSPGALTCDPSPGALTCARPWRSPLSSSASSPGQLPLINMPTPAPPAHPGWYNYMYPRPTDLSDYLLHGVGLLQLRSQSTKHPKIGLYILGVFYYNLRQTSQFLNVHNCFALQWTELFFLGYGGNNLTNDSNFASTSHHCASSITTQRTPHELNLYLQQATHKAHPAINCPIRPGAPGSGWRWEETEGYLWVSCSSLEAGAAHEHLRDVGQGWGHWEGALCVACRFK